MANRGIEIKAFHVFNATTGRELQDLAEQHHREDSQYTTEEYLDAFYELLRIQRHINRQMSGSMWKDEDKDGK